jgi:hypothetical protein
MEARITNMRRERDAMELDLKASQKEWKEQVKNLEIDLKIEKERADFLLTHGIQEKEELENHWRRMWIEQANSISEQLESLKANYEEPLKGSQAREGRLQV